MAEKKQSAADKKAAGDKKSALETALAQIEKQFGKGAVMKLGANTAMQVDSISTGSLGLDLALGVGGFPRGRIVEVYGPESSGKPRWRCMCWPKRKRQAARWPLSMWNTHWTPAMHRHWAWTLTACW